MARTERRFIDTLIDLNGGEVHQELTDALKEVVGRVLHTGRPGQLSLTLKIKKAAKGDATAMTLTADVKTKLPQAERGDSILFANPDDLTLTRNDPRQPRLADLDPPRGAVVSMPAAPDREAAQS